MENGNLVLDRHNGERVLIGDDIEVCLVSTRRGGGKLAIRAPKHIRVLRSEVRDRERPVDKGPQRGKPTRRAS